MEPDKASAFSSNLSLNKPADNNNKVIPDGGWGWVVVFAAFMIYAISEGVSFVFGLLFVEFTEEFRASKSATSWIGSLFMALPLIAGPICSTLVDKYGCRTMTIVGSLICALGFVLSSYATSIWILYITFGVIGGLARGLVYVTAIVSVAFWFEKKRSMALGISASGTGVGTVACAPFTAWLISEYGWRGAVLILGGFLANMCVCGALMVDPRWVKEEEKQNKLERSRNDHVAEEEGLVAKRKKTTSWVRTFFNSFGMFLELHFLLLCLGILFAATWFLVPFFYLTDHMLSLGYTDEAASFTLSAIGFANTLGMVLLGWLADRVNIAKLFGISLILCGISIWFIMIFSSNYVLLVSSSASFGFFFASVFSLSPSLLAQLVPLDDFTMGVGLNLLAEGVGHLVGPPIAGLITDLSNSWSASFYQAGFWVVVSGVLIMLISFTRNRGFFGHKLVDVTRS